MEDKDKNPNRDMTSSDKSMLTGMFSDRESTERAYKNLQERGYSDKDINMIMSDDTRNKHFKDDADHKTEVGTKAMETAGKGGAIGGTIGAVAGIIAALGTSLIIPGLGLLVA